MTYPDKISPFLTCVDKDNNELYIFHHNDPAYLIWVKPEIPMRFILIEYYDDSLTADDIMSDPSLAEARKYAKKVLQEGFDVN